MSIKTFSTFYIIWILFCVLISFTHEANGIYGFWGVYISGFPFSYFGNVMDKTGGLANILTVGFTGLAQWIVFLGIIKIFKK